MACVIVKEIEGDPMAAFQNILVQVYGLDEGDSAQLNTKCDGKMKSRTKQLMESTRFPTSKILSHLIELQFRIVSQSSMCYENWISHNVYNMTTHVSGHTQPQHIQLHIIKNMPHISMASSSL